MMCAAVAPTSSSSSSTDRERPQQQHNESNVVTGRNSSNHDDAVMSSSSSPTRLHNNNDENEEDAGGGVTGGPMSSSMLSSSMATSFPLKLHTMLNAVEKQQRESSSSSYADVVSWQEGGKSFRVHSNDRFASDVLPRFFNQTKFKSFQRQLNMYGFRRIQHGKHKGGYVHKSFVKGKPELSAGIKRRCGQKNNRTMAVAAKVVELVAKASAAAAAANSGDGTSPLSVADLFDDTPIQDYMASVDFGEDFNMSVLEDIFRDESGGGGDSNTDEATPFALSSLSLPQAIAASSNPEVAAAVVQEATEAVYRKIENMDGFLSEDDSSQDESEGGGDEVDNEMSEIKIFLRNLLDDTVDDEAKVASLLSQPAAAVTAAAATASVSPNAVHEDSASFSDEDKETEEQLSERVFPLKLHKMLENAQRDGIDDIVKWVDNGRGFKVYNPDAFTKKVMPMYFDQTKYESFRRQLNLYGFSRVSRGDRRGIYSHPMFVAGNRPQVITGVRRKLPSDVDNSRGFGNYVVDDTRGAGTAVTTSVDMEM